MVTRSSTAWALVCAVVAAGCDGAVAPDAGVADAATDAGVAEAALPDWGACPEGWAPRDVEGARICAPPPRVECTGASFQPVGAAACQPIDDGCTEARFRVERSDGRSYVFVDAAAGVGGDGSEGAPFTVLDDALRSGASGVLLAAGDYRIGVALPADVELRGACADRTRLIAPAGGLSIFVPPAQRAALVGITVTGSGIGPAARGTLVLDRVVLDAGLDGWGAGLNGGTLEASRVLIRAPHPTPDSAVGLGISMIAGSHATLRDVVVEDAHGVGIQVEESTLVAERVVVQGTRAEVVSGDHGGGLSAAGSASLTLTDSLVTDVEDFGIAAQSGSTLALTRVVVEDVRPAAAAPTPNGLGIEVRASTATLTSVLVERSAGAGLFLIDEGTTTATDVVVHDVQVLEELAMGIALTTSALTLDRAMLLDTSFAALVARGGTVSCHDLVVRRVGTARGGGLGVASSDGAHVEVTRFALAELHTMGALTVGEGATLLLADGTIRGVRANPELDIGRGVEAHSGGHVVLRAVTISDVLETAVLAFGLTETGIVVPGTGIEMTDVHIDGIGERACVSTTCPTEGGGTGVSALAGAVIDATELHVDGAPLCGVQVFGGGSLDVRSGEIARSAIGACVQIEGYDLARVVAGVRYVDNERSVETTGIYVPTPGPSLGD